MKRFSKLIVMAILALTVALGSLGGLATVFAEDKEVTASQVTLGASGVQTTIGETEKISFVADGYSNVAAFHVMLTLPSNVTFSGFTIGDNYIRSNYQYSINGEEISIICNSGNETFASETTLFSIDVCAREVGFGMIYFNSVFMTDVDAIEISCGWNSVGITVVGEETTTLMGDVDGDDAVSIADLMLMQRFILGSLSSDEKFSTEAADITGDGDINLVDCQHVQRYLVGKITLDELQSISQNSETPSVPETPTTDTVLNVYYGDALLSNALTVNLESGDTTFEFNGENIVGSSTFSTMIEETAESYLLMFVPYSSSNVYEFVLSGDDAKLDSVVDLDKYVEDNDTIFDSSLAGDYILDNGTGGGDVEIFDNGVFHATTYFNINDSTVSRVINGYIQIEKDGIFAYVFGNYRKQIAIDTINGTLSPIFNVEQPDTPDNPENPEETGTRFDIHYVYPSGEFTTVTTYYQVNYPEEIPSIAKEIASRNLPDITGCSVYDYEITYTEDGGVLVRVILIDNNVGDGGDIGQGTPISFYMVVMDDKSEMMEPLGPISISSVDQFNQMVANFSSAPAEMGMSFQGVYVDRDLSIAYTKDMGINVENIYIKYTILDSAGKLPSGSSGTYDNVKIIDTDNENNTEIDAVLTLDEKTNTFTFVIGEQTIAGDAIMIGASYNPDTGAFSSLELYLFANDEIQISGCLDFSDSNNACFKIYNEIYDYSEIESNEELKDIAGEYQMIIYGDGIQMGLFPVELKDNGIIVMNMLYMKQIGTYELGMTMAGVEFLMYVDGEEVTGTIDFDAKQIVVEMSLYGDDTNGPSVGDETGNDSYRTQLLMVVDGEIVAENEVYPYEDSYDALKDAIYEIVGEQYVNITVYTDYNLTTELTVDNFKTVNSVYYLKYNGTNNETDFGEDTGSLPSIGLN